MVEIGLYESHKLAPGKAAASVVITTRNRWDELCEAVRSALSQSVSVEVLVMDDGSTDGTAEIVRRQFPSVRLECSETSVGYIVQRNRAASLATGDIIFSLDDDAIFPSRHTLEQTLVEFDHPRIGAVAIPYVEPRKSNAVRHRAPASHEIFITDTFTGTAHALRRDVFLALRGYREPLFHQGEESDFAVRMLEAGYVVRLGRAEPIYHWESPKRDFRRMDFYGPRNSILFQWQNAPREVVLVGLVATTFNCLRWSLKPARFWVRFQGLIAGYRECGRLPRQPVRPETYRLWRQLRQQVATPLADLLPRLPAVLPGQVK